MQENPQTEEPQDPVEDNPSSGENTNPTQEDQTSEENSTTSGEEPQESEPSEEESELEIKTTPFTTVYDRFLSKITDDMYVELTPEDTVRDLQSLLLEAIPGFEFPRCLIMDYTISSEIKKRSEVTENDFVIGVIWHDLVEQFDQFGNLISPNSEDEQVKVEKSCFNCEVSPEEINILAILMMIAWVQRQVTSIEATRMKYSGTDFKMTSQANHLSKLLSLLSECQRQSHHMQRLYKRRRQIKDPYDPYYGYYRSNWDVFGAGVYYDRYN